jgi:MCP family monocarboxylic acid transporter-like MFS transporter 10
LGRRIGMLSSVIGLGSLFGPPISGAILNATSSLHPVSYFAAAVVLGGAVIMTGCRWCVIRGFWGKA